MTTEAEIRQEIAFFENACKELGIKLSELERACGFRTGIVRQWEWRLKKGHITQFRERNLKAMHEEVEKRRHLKTLTPTKVVQPSVPIPKHLLTPHEIARQKEFASIEICEESRRKQELDPVQKRDQIRDTQLDFHTRFDDEEPSFQIKATELPSRKMSGCEALTSIIRDKISGMSLVQLALLLAHIEQGNGGGK